MSNAPGVNEMEVGTVGGIGAEMSRPDDPWQVVLSRDRSWDGALFYAVRTTGIFCRPSCPSRRPRRENVTFFHSANDAAHAGYRPCHRCHPESAAGTTTERRIQRAIRYLDEHRTERITLEQLGDVVGLSPFHLQRAFRSAMGVSPRQYQEARRLEAMKERLGSGARVGTAVWEAGYGSMRGAYEAVARGTGMTPGRYRNGGAGVHITCAVRETRFGSMLVGWTASGVCAVVLGDSLHDVMAQLRTEFPAAEISEDGASAAVDDVLRHLEGTHPGLALPLDLHGTSFQLRVWEALRQIPAGEVRTYGEVAAAIGAPGSARAVARACAANRTALVVPCHRVVRSDGSPSGYRWGGQRKRQLLEHEGSVVRGPGAANAARHPK